MSRAFAILASLTLAAVSAAAPPPAFQDPLLDRMTGTWVLRGTIAGRETTHDIVGDWVLGHQYVRLHEVSREKSAGGQPEYEAIVFIGWDEKAGGYACLWLDSTGGGGLSAQAIGHGRRNGDEIAFLFRGSDGSTFHTTFAYARDAGTWQWLMDGEDRGKLQPFARVRLTKE
ncbi:MAG: hypothetical protein ABR961_10360 [Thermoanaerobaculaceae bacterium]|jgi:hypothetical protein